MTTRHARLRPTRLRSLIGAGGIAVGALILTAPLAHAQEQEAQIRARCENNGGEYSTYFNANGDRVSQCCIKMNGGARLYCHYYLNGNYDGSQMWNREPSPPPTPVTPLPPVAAQPVKPPSGFQ